MPPDANVAAPLMAVRLEELCIVAHRVTLNMPLPDGDDLAFMSACFLARQLEHASAMILLGEHPDAWLVARCMLEGMWQLKLAASEAGTLPTRWRRFCHIHDWRLLSERDGRGESTGQATRDEITSAIAEHGEQFLSARAREQRGAGNGLPDDPYDKTWYHGQIRQIAEKAGDLDLYLTAYSDFSERQHWDVSGVARGILIKDESITYNGSSAGSKVIAMTIAFQCLALSALLIDKVFDRGLRSDILGVVEAHIRDGQKFGINVELDASSVRAP